MEVLTIVVSSDCCCWMVCGVVGGLSASEAGQWDGLEVHSSRVIIWRFSPTLPSLTPIKMRLIKRRASVIRASMN